MPWAGEKFEDAEFPTAEASLGPIKVTGVEWKRPGEFRVYKEPKTEPFSLLPEDGVDPSDINQNQIGDCWLLSALSTLAMNPKWIEAAFQAPVNEAGEPALNPAGKYIIRMFDVREQKVVNIQIDDRIPCTKGEDGVWAPIGVTIRSGAIWPALLEKAVAKFFGSYKAIEGGRSDWALAAFTGHVGGVYLFDKENHCWFESRTCHKAVEGDACRKRCLTLMQPEKPPVSTGTLLMEVRKWLDSEQHSYMTGAGSQASGDGTHFHNIHGVPLSHAYGILGVYPQEAGFTLVKLRNPWGNAVEWQGAWSDGDALWGQYPEVAEAVGYEPGADGTFFISTEDFAQLFTMLFYVRLPYEAEDEQGEEDEDEEVDPEAAEWYGEEEGDEDEGEAEGEDEDEEEEDEDVLARIEKVFDMFDMDGSGELSVRELTKGLKSVGFSKKQIREALEAVDTDEDGAVTFEEFKEWFVENGIEIDAE